MVLSQNKKIAITSVALFMVSLSVMLVFLESGGKSMEGHGQTSVVHQGAGGHGEPVKKPETLPLGLDLKYKPHFSQKNQSVFVTKADGNIAYSNDFFCKMMRTECKGLKDKQFFDLVNNEDVADFAKHHSKVVAEGAELQGFGPYRLKAGEGQIMVLLSAYPVLNDQSQVTSVIFKARDITAQVQKLSTGLQAEARKVADK